MAEPQNENGLQITEMPRFVRASWMVQRIGWLAMALLVIAALLGLTGGIGPLNAFSMGAEDGPLRLLYHSPARKHADTLVEVTLRANADGTARVWISRDYIDTMEISQINPQPEQVEAAADRLIFSFNAADASQPIRITFTLKPLYMGTLSGRVGLDDDETAFEFEQFILP